MLLGSISPFHDLVPAVPPVLPATPPRKIVSGQYLAKNKLGPSERAKLAADLIDGRAALGPLTANQITALCHSNPSSVAKARGPARRRTKPATAESLADHLRRCSHDEWCEAARAVGGVAVIWDRMIEPLLA
jgi:hypothetical protein